MTASSSLLVLLFNNFPRFQCTTSLLNTLSNPIVYIVTNRHFKEYCWNKTRSLSSRTTPLIHAASPDVINKRRSLNSRGIHRVSPSDHDHQVSPSNYDQQQQYSNHNQTSNVPHNHRSQKDGNHQGSPLDLANQMSQNDLNQNQMTPAISPSETQESLIKDKFQDSLSTYRKLPISNSKIGMLQVGHRFQSHSNLSNKSDSSSPDTDVENSPEDGQQVGVEVGMTHGASVYGGRAFLDKRQACLVIQPDLPPTTPDGIKFKTKGFRSFHRNSPQQKPHGRPRNHTLSATRNQKLSNLPLNSV